MGMYQRADGSIHAGYQSHPQHIQWGNISQGAAHSPDSACSPPRSSAQQQLTCRSPSLCLSASDLLDRLCVVLVRRSTAAFANRS